MKIRYRGALPVAIMSLFGMISISCTNGKELVVATGNNAAAVIVASPDAGPWEMTGVAELARAIELMCGQSPKIINTRDAIAAALAGDAPVIVLGKVALAEKPGLESEIAAVLKKKPYLRTDGIALKRDGNRIYAAGNNDYSHYYAVAELLRRWGCRWYIPTAIGECIPEVDKIAVGKLDHVYSSPFEVRSYWISWIGDGSGKAEFQRRNMMGGTKGFPGTGHILATYVKDLASNPMKVPLTDPKTAEHIATQIEERFAKDGLISLGMEDGAYDSDYPRDQELMKLQWDKYFMRWSVSDAFLELYNNVAKILQDKYPDSKAKIGFLLYVNLTIPPVRDMKAERSLFADLAPIDIDPIHGMDDLQSPPRREFRDMMYEWAKIFDGRIRIYDYDQGMLVWRDIPNPSHMGFQQDVKHYAKAGIMGFNTESRNAIATTFLNLHIRGRLMWNPDTDVDALLDEFYPAFYGPAAEPMRVYWSTIYDAWEKSIITEHEYFVAPAIYTPEVMKVLGEKFAEAEAIINNLQKQGRALTRNEKLYVERMKFTRYSYLITKGYMDMVRAAATECDFATAVEIGDATVALRDELTDWNGIFTTYRGMNLGDAYPWWPGEVKQYRELIPYMDGTKGKLIKRLPLEWALRRDPDNSQKASSLSEVDLTYWNKHNDELTLDNRRLYPTNEWEIVRSDLYAQAQGLRMPDRQSFTGTLWYRTEIDLTADQTKGPLHIRFPGIFNKTNVYINGEQAARRDGYNDMWWHNDYRYEMDVATGGKLKAGKNIITVQCINPHHFGGMFRRPFLYKKVGD